MKRKNLLLIILTHLFISPLFSQNDSLQVIVKEAHTSSFTRLIVKSNVKVVLFQSDSAGAARMEGSEKFLENVFIIQTGSDLIINAKTFKDLKKEGAVYIPFRGLQYIEIYADAKIISYTTITSPELNILINGNCIVSLVLKGKLNICKAETYNWSFRREYENSNKPIFSNKFFNY